MAARAVTKMGGLRSRLPWKIKLRPEQEPVVVADPVRGGTMLVPTPMLVAEEIRRVRRGHLVTASKIRERLAHRFGVDRTCPLTTGIFLSIVAGAAEEQLQGGQRPVAPYWRVVDETGRLNPKLPPGPDRQAAHLRREGHTLKRVTTAARWIVVRMAVVMLLGSAAKAGEPDFARLFAGRDGCFALYDLKENRLVVRSNPERCAQRTSPCSTFKVPLSLMAFDAGILTDESSAMKWDGTKYARDVWNRDQTATTWMRDSVVWFSQRLTTQLGMEKVKSYLARFAFGNQDMSGGLTKAWLESTLLISPDEELRFWEQFWREQLPVGKHAYAMTKAITLVETSPAGWTLHGKTGSGARGAGGARQKMTYGLGWFVGHVAKGDREYLFVTSYTDRVPSLDHRPPGWIARDIAKQALEQMGLY